MAQVKITGSTYDIRDYLKSAGGQYDGSDKSWTLDADKWQSLLDSYGYGSNKRDKARAAAFNGCSVEPVASDDV